MAAIDLPPTFFFCSLQYKLYWVDLGSRFRTIDYEVLAWFQKEYGLKPTRNVRKKRTEFGLKRTEKLNKNLHDAIEYLRP